MTIRQIYNLALELGIAADPRGKRGVEKWLEREKKNYQRLSKIQREFFDKERLTNPYSDTRFHYGDPNKKVSTIVAGIDVEAPEIALIKAFDKKVDLIITHHPIGKSLTALDQVMNLQAEFMTSVGVPINVAEDIIKERLKKIARNVSAANYLREIDAARFANIALMNLHSVCDNLIYQFLQKLIDRKKPETIGEIIELLLKIPEYKIAAQNSAGPMIFAGSPENSAGKIFAFDTTGGTSGPKETYPELAKAGVGTIIGMHMPEESREEASKNHLNVVIAGHISSDSLGMNLFLDKLAEKGIKIIPIGGLIRVRRK